MLLAGERQIDESDPPPFCLPDPEPFCRPGTRPIAILPTRNPTQGHFDYLFSPTQVQIADFIIIIKAMFELDVNLGSSKPIN